MPHYIVLTRILGREPTGEDLPGAVIEMAADADAAHLVAIGALELAGDLPQAAVQQSVPPSTGVRLIGPKPPRSPAPKPPRKAKAQVKTESVVS